ncbi:hypothetical protein J2X97_000212 [Epilithonimonas hungarica]|uniref:hypothetical protein n=1 Tax=Epilithonimonas hungarica TaxID=454006 RepID=UPI0012C9F38D|nr:hypothetical protein [Epilithonimonas hungarica]MDP9954575.1 hypothetical protein [Epilithonimonas hungarica]MPT33262.1 hypothetical protein [Chryseobacterium sp.]
MKILKIGLIASAFAMLLISCKTVAQSSQIESITFRNTYGRGGFTSITATKDSLIATSAGGRMTDYPNFNKKINSKDWEKLVSGLDISVIDKTQNGARRGVYDGHDEIFSIVTKDKEYEIFNASEDAQNYKQLEKLKTNLNNLLSQYK